jgi:hypothetical protein
MESLECPNAFAKQVLSQLSYTPTVGYSNHFPSLTQPPQPPAASCKRNYRTRAVHLATLHAFLKTRLRWITSVDLIGNNTSDATLLFGFTRRPSRRND